LLISLFGVDRVRSQAPVDASATDRERNLPEPDVAVLSEWRAEFGLRQPRGNELIVAIEVSDTTLYSDTTGKRDLYARAGVPEYWVIDLNARRVMVYRSVSEGIYTQVSIAGENESVTLEGHSIAAARLLP
jgi:Uma2 family endonuclease